MGGNEPSAKHRDADADVGRGRIQKSCAVSIGGRLLGEHAVNAFEKCPGDRRLLDAGRGDECGGVLAVKAGASGQQETHVGRRAAAGEVAGYRIFDEIMTVPVTDAGEKAVVGQGRHSVRDAGGVDVGAHRGASLTPGVVG